MSTEPLVTAGSQAPGTQIPPGILPSGAASLVAGYRPAHPRRLLGVGALIGFVLSAVWSAPFVDQTIGDTVASALYGNDFRLPAPGVVAGMGFALVSGLAGTFTACNIAALGAMGPLLSGARSRRDRLRSLLRPLALLSGGMLAVSASYGALVGVLGTRMPQFSTAKPVPGRVPALLVQSMVVFGLVGAAMLYLALAALRLVPDPFARISRRFPGAPVVFMGVLVGGFLVGRPFPLFRAMFRDAATRHDPLFGAVAFSLQSLGNIVVLSVLFVGLTLLLGGRTDTWLARRPHRMAAVTVVGLAAAGTFSILYWDVRLLAVLDVIPWYPLAPWV